MITCDENGAVVVKVNDTSYNLSKTDQYTDFLMWITAPDPAVAIDEAMLEVDPSCPSEAIEKLNRYKEFLAAFVNRREALLEKAPTSAAGSQRISEINSLVDRLKSQASS
ncbi:hypothetical protein [uncultured Olegusella sp.]|uniref:hypothetical protein n=1 Tax=uncultured Olegusella sp. TaxID=1979846 RepID=UPI0026184445|nr:hypothetical protein [uncultured Olegusella sp.]